MSGNSSRRRSQTAPIVCRSRGRARFGDGRHRRRNVIRYLPIWTSSSSSSTLLSIRRLLTNVPLRLPRSRIVNTFAVADELGVPARDRDVVEEDVALGRAADQRPVADRLEALPRPAAAGADDERRPVDALAVARRRARPGRGSASSRRRSRARAAPRSASSTSPPPGSGSRTPGSRCGSLPSAEDRARGRRRRRARRRRATASRARRG